MSLLLNFNSNKNLKIVAASFTGFRAIIKTYPKNLLKSGKFNNILSAILKKMKEHDADKNIKSSLLRCLGPIYKTIFI